VNFTDLEPFTKEEFSKKVRIIDAQTELKLCAFHYKKDCNPLHVWQAINACTYYKVPFPPWVLNYLQEVSAKLTQYAYGFLDQGKKKQSDVYKILGMSKGRTGPGDFFQNFSANIKNVHIGVDIYRKIKKENRNDITKIIEEVANENGVSIKTVENIWYGNKSAGIESFRKSAMI
jgi:hypothetical protein